MAATFVQKTDTSNSSPANSINVSYASNVTAGSLLVALFGWADTSLTASFADGRNGSWSAAASSKSSNAGFGYNTEVFYFPNAAAGATTVTATLSGTAGYMWLVVLEFGSAATSSPLDASNSATGGSSAVSGSLTTVTDNALIVACSLVSAITPTAGSGFTLASNLDGNGGEYKLDAGAHGSNTVAFGGGNDPNWTLSMAAFKPSTGGGGGSTVEQLAQLGVG